MPLKTVTTAWPQVEADWLVVGIPEDGELTGHLEELNQSLDGRLQRLKEAGDLTGKLAELLPLRDVSEITAQRLLLVGLGQQNELDVSKYFKALMTAVRFISDKKNVTAAFALPDVSNSRLSAEQAAQMTAVATQVGGVGQDLYRSEPARFPFREATLLGSKGEKESSAKQAAEKGGILGEAMNLTRELVNRAAFEIYPSSFAGRAEKLADQYGLECDILTKKRLKKENMNALLAVAQGSERSPRVVVLKHNGGGENAPTLALCGKGVTFDSGGLSLKPTQGMLAMKADMTGAATVLGAMTAVARLDLPVKVVGYMGMVENMPSGSCYKVGDVLTARNGVTIEVQNTDAEGRLVLADVLSYAVDQGADKLVDLATLTGACVVALGEEVTGVFTNHQEWCEQVTSAAREEGEDVWQLPMFEAYSELIKSDVADIKNTGGRWGGAITAAKLLERFVGEKPWVHLDIAGPSFASGNLPHREGGATGCMVRTLVEAASNFEGQ